VAAPGDADVDHLVQADAAVAIIVVEIGVKAGDGDCALEIHPTGRLPFQGEASLT
jgi:hypothetical protein